MSSPQEQHIATYREEAGELLAELETSLLELEDNPQDNDLINRVFRAMHTIKGSGAMFGFDDIARFTHEVETVFDQVRNGKMQVTRCLLDLTLQARDQITTMLEASAGGPPADEANGQRIIDGLQQLLPQATKLKQEPVAAAPAQSAEADTSRTYRIRFKPLPEIMLGGTNPISLLNELRDLGSCEVMAHLDAIPSLDQLTPEHCYFYWDIILTTTRGIEAIKDVFIFVEDDCDLKIDLIDDGTTSDGDTSYKKLGDILVERGDLSPVEMQKILSMQKRFGEILVEQGLVPVSKVQSALLEQQQVKQARQERTTAAPAAAEASLSIRVPAERLDHLVNLVGELVTVQAHLTQIAGNRHDNEISAVAEEVERLISELRDTTLNMRMLPIGSTFSKFKRLVRDLSAELGKEIDLETTGAETELDKTVIEKLNDPLVHLIRNSIDHGVEMPDVRKAAGKPAKGIVHLAAVHSGDSVLVTIRDDGAGLDKERIKAKAIERGLITATTELTDKEIYNLIFAPGFSTAQKVTSVSGRGVGMDVVKKAIEALRGTIDIASEQGKGSIITLRIPLTLAIIETLLVRIDQSYFVLPLTMVEECIELTRADVQATHGRHLAHVRGELTPYINLRDEFEIATNQPEIEQIVILSVNGKRIGFVVDDVVGEHQTVIKTLGKLYRDVRGISGATILGDGTVALILDPGLLVQSVAMIEQEQFG
ncbi:chemotaxis protein CheA [Trichlorobacter lovleyi]|jgi:CheA signal transduction histidine kinase|uniref:Chemotaxis protein CheA n=1 Tax=Trichlorobacter lovleyi (strain ATCC BAA-1151 / DSM 17278 / SZ) TaxID=398767 RepID=B3EAL6_TRIL1|nr:chemotaxis protein CheA [Trichlorobacter lovleyi]ACD95454.1 CheA signal transduction histidine kinase [Trichlorobacter lovleyi SZ]